VSTTIGSPVLPVYARQDLTFVRGEGTILYDGDGGAYLDFLAGIAVVGLGHCHPAPLAAAHAQLDRLWHVSNLYWTEPMVALAERLSARAGGAGSFFCNSGSESVEAGLKYARKATGRPGIVALNGSFHGRTIGALSVTGQPVKRTAFEPLLPQVRFADPNDIASLESAVSADTGCVLVEPVQGEGGVHVLDAAFVAAARRLADRAGAVLLFDEVQTGVGRTGTFFAYERLGVRPDAVMLAKGLGNGLPIGCLLVLDDAPEGFAAGDHASTFGGNPVACAAAAAVCDELTEDLLSSVRTKGSVLATGLAGLRGVREVRGAGLMLGAELAGTPADVVAECAERGLLVGTAGTDVLRLTPPLTVTTAEIEQALGVLEEVLA
jgi:acetylornithine/N-succinyldiaminopimelate aminotransferase